MWGRLARLPGQSCRRARFLAGLFLLVFIRVHVRVRKRIRLFVANQSVRSTPLVTRFGTDPT